MPRVSVDFDGLRRLETSARDLDERIARGQGVVAAMKAEHRAFGDLPGAFGDPGPDMRLEYGGMLVDAEAELAVARDISTRIHGVLEAVHAEFESADLNNQDTVNRINDMIAGGLPGHSVGGRGVGAPVPTAGVSGPLSGRPPAGGARPGGRR